MRSALLRKGGPSEDEFRPGDMVAFMRKQKTGGWVGPARVLATEQKNIWLLHAGIPILVSSNRVRGANAEEHLEVELLNKRRLSRKRPFMDAEAVRQPHRMEPQEGQIPYLDARPGGGSPDAPDGDDSPRKSPRKARQHEPSFQIEEEAGDVSPMNYSPPSPLPEQTLSSPQQGDISQPQQQQEPALLPQGLRPEDVPVPAEEAELAEIPDSVIYMLSWMTIMSILPPMPKFSGDQSLDEL